MNIINCMNKKTKILAIATIACMIVTLLLSVNTIKYYTEDKSTVCAEISKIEEYDNSAEDNSDWGYNVYVNYEYNHKKYNNVFYGEVSGGTELKVGDRIDVEIFLDKPDEIATNTLINICFFLIAAVFLLFITVKAVRNDINSSE